MVRFFNASDHRADLCHRLCRSVYVARLFEWLGGMGHRSDPRYGRFKHRDAPFADVSPPHGVRNPRTGSDPAARTAGFFSPEPWTAYAGRDARFTPLLWRG